SFAPGAPGTPIPNFQTRGVAVIDGQIYVERIDGGARTDVYSRSGTYQRTISTPQTNSLGGDDVGLSTLDWYSVTLATGQEVRLATSTASDGPGGFANALDPRIELFGTDGALAAAGTEGSDGRNETPTYV